MPRQSPAESATQAKVGTEKKGLDGNLWQVVAITMKTGKVVQRWKKTGSGSKSSSKSKSQPKHASHKVPKHASHKVPKHYFIHDNGGRPFVVFMTKTSATVYREPPTEEWDDDRKKNNVQNYTQLVHKFSNVKKAFVGMDHNADNHYLPPHFGDGNSILLYMGKTQEGRKYVSIGNSIYSFTTPHDDEIVNYWSDIGNNNVPYPVALGKKYVYFTIEDAYVPRDVFAPNIEWHNAYIDFYGHTDNPWYHETYGKLWNPKNKYNINKGFHRKGKLFEKYTRTLPHRETIQKRL